MCQNCEELQKEIQRLSEENAQLREENAQLKRRLMLYENPHTPPSRRRYPTTHPHSHNLGKRFPGRPRGHPGKTRPAPKPDVVEKPEWENCPHCGAHLSGPSHVRHHIVEEISNPSPKTVIDFLEFEGRCDRCGGYVAVRHPDCPPEGRFGKNLYVQTTLMKFEDRLPIQKVGWALERQHGISLTPATILDLTRRVSDWLRPEYERILQIIRCADVVYADETGAKVDGKRHWTWVFTTPSETLIAIRKSRGKKVLEEILGENFEGVIICDGWKSYLNFTTRIQRCWSHLLREAEYLAENIAEAKPLSEALHELYHHIKNLPKDRPPPEVMANLVEDARRTMNYWVEKNYETEEVRKFAAKIRNGADHWFTFLTTPGVEPTNGRAERALRECVVQRKIIGTFRNGKGTRTYETIMTMLATWKQQGLNLYKALAENLTKAWAKS
nr:IS66 family transposase [Candidatus Freyarchaeota archaeon]